MTCAPTRLRVQSRGWSTIPWFVGGPAFIAAALLVSAANAPVLDVQPILQGVTEVTASNAPPASHAVFAEYAASF